MVVRKALERLWVGRCKITNSQEVFSSLTGQTSYEDVVICDNEPCRLSYSSIKDATETSTVTPITQVIKLFIKPELVIKAGSKIVVTQNGKVTNLVASGESAVYTNHQEIVLHLEGDYA